MNRERFRRTTAPLSVETTGKTVDEAVQAALSRLRARRDEVDIRVLQEGRGGFLGLGAKEARVRVQRRESGGSPRGGERPSGDRDRDRDRERGDRDRDRGDRDRDRGPARGGRDTGVARGPARVTGRRAQDDLDRLEEEIRTRRQARANGAAPRGARPIADRGPAPAPAPAPAPMQEPASPAMSAPSDYEGDRGSRRRRRGSRGGSSRGEARGGDGRGGEGRGFDGRSSEGRGAEIPGSESRSGAPAGGSRDRDRDLSARVITAPSGSTPKPTPEGLPDPANLAKFAQELLQRMGYTSQVEASFVDDAYEVRIEAGENDAVLIGKKGETLDALQHILAKMVSRGHEELLRVRVDVSEYRQRRTSELSDRALEFAKQVQETGREVVTEPFTASERRIIHRTLSDLPDITTVGLGEGLLKRVWIGRPGEEPAQERGPAPSPHRPQVSHAREESPTIEPGGPVSLIESWDAPKKSDPAAVAEEWGRKPKPARGRRR